MPRLEAYRHLLSDQIVETEGYWVTTRKGGQLLDIQSGGQAVINGYSQYGCIDAIAESQKKVSFIRGNISQTSDEIERLTEFLERCTSYKAMFYTVTGTSAVEAAYSTFSDRKWITTISSYHGTGYLSKQFRQNGSVDFGDYNKLEEQFKANPGAVFFTETISWSSYLQTWDFSIVRKLCDQYDILLIVDDIGMCNWRGSDRFLTTDLADVVLVGKANTSGYAPLSIVMFNDKAYRIVRDKPIQYGHTYHPYLPGVVAMLWTMENTVVQTNNIEQRHKLLGDQLLDLGYIKEYKAVGCWAVMRTNVEFGYEDTYKFGLEHYTLDNTIRLCTMQIADDTYFNQLESRLCDLLETKMYGKSL